MAMSLLDALPHAIEEILADDALRARAAAAGERIRSANGLERATALVEGAAR